MRLLPHNPPIWPEVFRECKRTAFHLEVRDTYAVPQESDRLRRFLNGESPLPDEYKNQWVDLMRETTGRGVAIGRVRVVTMPHTDYQRWLLSVTGSNVDAGDDIRYVPRHLAGEVPPDDWWLMDDARVIFNMVDENGKPAGLSETVDAGIVSYCCGVKERLWELAIPYAEYVESEYALR